jgi:hypothetical protein
VGGRSHAHHRGVAESAGGFPPEGDPDRMLDVLRLVREQHLLEDGPQAFPGRAAGQLRQQPGGVLRHQVAQPAKRPPAPQHRRVAGDLRHLVVDVRDASSTVTGPDPVSDHVGPGGDVLRGPGDDLHLRGGACVLPGGPFQRLLRREDHGVEVSLSPTVRSVASRTQRATHSMSSFAAPMTPGRSSAATAATSRPR